jgi:hypothetical protein
MNFGCACSLGAMVDDLGIRKEVKKGIEDNPWKQESAQCVANFSHANKDGEAVMTDD